jgi:hypothetical protein
MAERYITAAALKSFANSTKISDLAEYVEAAEAGESFLDTECARSFDIAGAASARSFRPRTSGSAVLWIRDCTTITSVVENGTTLTANVDYIAEPRADENWSGEVRPFDRLCRVNGTWYANNGIPTVTVTATWGWAAFPPGLTLAAKVCAKAYLETRDIRFGLAAIAETGGVGERQVKAVADFIANYRGHQSWGIA